MIDENDDHGKLPKQNSLWEKRFFSQFFAGFWLGFAGFLAGFLAGFWLANSFLSDVCFSWAVPQPTCATNEAGGAHSLIRAEFHELHEQGTPHIMEV